MKQIRDKLESDFKLRNSAEDQVHFLIVNKISNSIRSEVNNNLVLRLKLMIFRKALDKLWKIIKK